MITTRSQLCAPSPRPAVTSGTPRRSLQWLGVLVALCLLLPTAVAAQVHAADPATAVPAEVDHYEAEEHEAGDHGGKSNIFAGDIGNVLWTLIVFLLALFVLSKFAWKPLLGLLEEREGFIRSALVEAKSDREAAEARLREYDEKLAGARAEATAIVEEARRDAEATRSRVESEARQEADRMLARARREIDIARDTAVRELYTVSATLATRIAGRIVGRELDAKDHQRLIDSSIDELGRIDEAH